MMRWGSNLVSAVLGVIAAPLLAHACAVCLTGAAEDPLTDALNWSVLFLMAAPYTVAGAIAAWLVYLNRRSIPAESDAPTSLAILQKESGR